MNYLSVCSGIEAASVAWHGLGWVPVAFSEIEKFPSAVLARHWPDVPNLGDMTNYENWTIGSRPELIVGGTPCQSFSVAGLRKGLADARGNLTLVFLGILERFRPRWVVWENVPGVLSDKTGAFGAFLGGLGKLGYGFAYRILDAQHFGVPQRRRRVFVVGYLGDWRRAGAVLFEPESLRGDPPPRREAGEKVAALTANGVGTCGADDNQGQAGHLIPEVANPLTARMHKGINTTMDEGQTMIAHSLRGEGHDASEDGTGRGTPIVSAAANSNDGGGTVYVRVSHENPVAFSCKDHGADAGDQSPTLRSMTSDKSHANGGGQVAVAFAENSRHEIRLEGGDGRRTGTLSGGGGKPGQGAPMIAGDYAVRRLTPTECERLQGFPDGHTLIPWRGRAAELCPDGPRYKALGNSMAVPVMRWIGERIAFLDLEKGGND